MSAIIWNRECAIKWVNEILLLYPERALENIVGSILTIHYETEINKKWEIGILQRGPIEELNLLWPYKNTSQQKNLSSLNAKYNQIINRIKKEYEKEYKRMPNFLKEEDSHIGVKYYDEVSLAEILNKTFDYRESTKEFHKSLKNELPFTKIHLTGKNNNCRHGFIRFCYNIHRAIESINRIENCPYYFGNVHYQIISPKKVVERLSTEEIKKHVDASCKSKEEKSYLVEILNKELEAIRPYCSHLTPTSEKEPYAFEIIVFGMSEAYRYKVEYDSGINLYYPEPISWDSKQVKPIFIIPRNESIPFSFSIIAEQVPTVRERSSLREVSYLHEQLQEELDSVKKTLDKIVNKWEI